MNPKALNEPRHTVPTQSPPQLAAAGPSALHAAPVLHGGRALLPHRECAETYGLGFSLHTPTHTCIYHHIYTRVVFKRTFWLLFTCASMRFGVAVHACMCGPVCYFQFSYMHLGRWACASVCVGFVHPCLSRLSKLLAFLSMLVYMCAYMFIYIYIYICMYVCLSVFHMALYVSTCSCASTLPIHSLA